MVTEWIMAFISLCQAAIASGKVLVKVKDSQLTVMEKELLRTAADDGQFHLAYDELVGRHVFTNTREFTADDPAVTAKYLDAFTKLCSQGLVVHQHEEIFRLSGQGFDIARRLRNGRSRPDVSG